EYQDQQGYCFHTPPLLNEARSDERSNPRAICQNGLPSGDFSRGTPMTRLKSPRLILAVGLIAALSIAVVAQQRSTATSMTTAATAFLASLTPEQRQQATFAFDSAERLRWHFVPQFERNGLQIKAMTEPQRKLAHDLLKTGLSARGY